MRFTAKNIVTITVCVANLTVFSACSGGAGLSNNGAQEILDEAWGDQYEYILLGSVKVVNGPDDIEHRRISLAAFKAVQAWAQAGLINLKILEVTQENFGSGDRFLALVLDGVSKVIEVTATQEGTALQAASKLKIPLEDRFLYARLYRSEVGDIVENQQVKKSTDLYRVVKGTVNTTWNDTGVKVYAAWGVDMTPQQRFVALLKFDPFDKAWKLAAFDADSGDGGFDSDNVRAALGE